jgi:hypothetical protein
MIPFPRSRAYLAFALLSLVAGVLRLGAQELSVLGGGTTTRDAHFSSYAYQFDYRQNFNQYIAGSFAYINEGHIPGHHRDGDAFEGWFRLPLFKGQLALSAGAGGYFYYDTQPVAGGDAINVHGSAPIYSLSANLTLSHRWFLKGTINRISPRHDVKTATSLVGLGFWFGRERKPTKGKMGAAPEDYSYVTPNELTLFGGQSIVNSLLSQHAWAGAVEYRRGLIPHVDWSVTGISEGNPRITRRDGLATQVWAVNTFFQEKVAVGAGLGPYFYIDRRHPTPHTLTNPAAAAPLASLTVATKLDEHWLARLTFNRVTSDYNRDADILLVGLGYRWGGRSH